MIYVDDLLITDDDVSLIQETKAYLQENSKIKDLGELKYLLGLEFARNKEGILMQQRKYALDLIFWYGLGWGKVFWGSYGT